MDIVNQFMYFLVLNLNILSLHPNILEFQLNLSYKMLQMSSLNIQSNYSLTTGQ